MNTSKLYLSGLAVMIFGISAFAQHEQMCQMAKPEEQTVDTLDEASMQAVMEGTEGDCKAKLEAGIAAYVSKNMAFGQAVSDGSASADEFLDEFRNEFSLPKETEAKLAKLTAKWGDRTGKIKDSTGEEASCPMAKDDPTYFECKANKLREEFGAGDACDLDGLIAKNVKQQAKLNAANAELTEVINEISTTALAACQATGAPAGDTNTEGVDKPVPADDDQAAPADEPASDEPAGDEPN